MGVINLTPNSFSDGHENLTLDTVFEKIQSVLEWADILDFGAESTAPQSSKISAEEEFTRFERLLLPLVHRIDFKGKVLSIDTYKIDVMKEVKLALKGVDCKVMFNDVSGDVSDELLSFLSINSDLSYVVCDNLAPTRVQTGDHMDFLFKGENASYFQLFLTNMNKRLEKLKALKTEIYVDPAFGFSKSKEQNLYLLSRFSELHQEFGKPLVMGISRKSFLRPAGMDKSSSEHHGFLDQVAMNFHRGELGKSTLFRVHDPTPFSAYAYYSELAKV